ncbi:MAG: 50S ribosomal protein L23 [Candidatus Levyibacteriota bacterium]|nr:MAG: 50S ribosomal protein L23 [Candidatus Levybacteria bacterium]
MDKVLIRPLITEKSINDAQNGKFTFIIAESAHKNDIKKAVEDQFKVHVVAIATIITKGKSKRVGRKRQIVKERPAKKAIIKLAAGEKIDLFDLKASTQKK